MEFELPEQITEPSFLFDLSLSKAWLFRAMLKNTPAFRQYFASLLDRHSQLEPLPRPNFRQQAFRAIAKVLQRAGTKEYKNDRLCVDLIQELDGETWRCFEQGLTPQSVWGCWLQEIKTCLELRMISRLTRSAEHKLAARLKQAWQGLLASSLSSTEESQVRLAKMLLELVEKDKEKILLMLMPQLYRQLVKKIETNEEATEELMVLLDKAAEVFTTTYKVDLTCRSGLNSWHSQGTVSKLSQGQSQDRKRRTLSARGVEEYYLGRLDKAVLFWSQEIAGGLRSQTAIV